MSYRNYGSYGQNTYTPTYDQRYGFSNISKNYSSKNDDNVGELQYMLQNQRKKFREAKQKYEYDLDNERKIRIEFQNKLIRLKDQFSRKQVALSELEFRINNLLQQNQDIVLENQRLKAEIHRMEDIYGGKIRELQTQLDMETRSFEDTTLQYNSQFDKFKKQGQEYVEQLTFEFQRKIKNLQDKLKGSEISKRELSMQVKKLNDILVNNKLNFEEQIRDLRNRCRDQEMRKNNSLVKSFESKLKMVEQGRQILVRKNKELLKALQDKDRRIQQFELDLKDSMDRVQHEKTELTQQINHLNYLVGKLKSEINQKDTLLGRRVNDSEGQLSMLRNQLSVKRQEINRLAAMNQSLRINLKEIESEQERKRRQLVQKCNIWEGEARKYKEEYTRICEVLKSKINDTINNVGRSGR